MKFSQSYDQLIIQTFIVSCLQIFGGIPLISIETTLEPDKNWNNRMIGSKTGTFVQTKEFADSKKLFGAEPLYFTFLDNTGKIVGQLVSLIHEKYQNRGKLGKILKSLPGTKNALCRWFYGPVIFDNNFELQIQEELYKFLNSKKYQVWGSAHPFSNCSFSNFKKPFSISDWATFVLDLDTKDTIWENMAKHSARKNIERSQSRNVTIKQMQRNDLELFLQLSNNSTKDLEPIPIFTLKKQWDLLQPVGYDGFIAYENNEPIGGIKIASFNGYLYEFEVIRTKHDYTKKLYSQDLLKWHIINWGIKNNFSFYDFAGINPNPINDKEKGIFRYKQKWGGNLMNFKIVKM